jgi:hypothetical protein
MAHRTFAASKALTKAKTLIAAKALVIVRFAAARPYPQLIAEPGARERKWKMEPCRLRQCPDVWKL